MVGAYPSLELSNFFVSERVGFGDDGYQVDFCVQLTHELDVNRLETETPYQILHCCIIAKSTYEWPVG